MKFVKLLNLIKSNNFSKLYARVDTIGQWKKLIDIAYKNGFRWYANKEFEYNEHYFLKDGSRHLLFDSIDGNYYIGFVSRFTFESDPYDYNNIAYKYEDLLLNDEELE